MMRNTLKSTSLQRQNMSCFTEPPIIKLRCYFVQYSDIFSIAILFEFDMVVGIIGIKNTFHVI